MPYTKEEIQRDAQAGIPIAENILGKMYRDGNEFPQSYTEALKWFTRAVNHNYIEALSNLAVMYFKGQGVNKDDGKALELFKRAGGTKSKRYIGEIYKRSNRLFKDTRAFRYFYTAADWGDTPASYYVGYSYLFGIGTSQNDKQAAIWFRKAAERGHAKAQYHLGLMYRNALGDIKSDKKAYLWFREAASRGHTEAQYLLSKTYTDGQGVPKDDIRACKWLQRAADQGHIDALKKLNEEKIKDFSVFKDEKKLSSNERKAPKKSIPEKTPSQSQIAKKGQFIFSSAITSLPLSQQSSKINPLAPIPIRYIEKSYIEGVNVIEGYKEFIERLIKINKIIKPLERRYDDMLELNSPMHMNARAFYDKLRLKLGSIFSSNYNISSGLTKTSSSSLYKTAKLLSGFLPSMFNFVKDRISVTANSIDKEYLKNKAIEINAAMDLHEITTGIDYVARTLALIYTDMLSLLGESNSKRAKKNISCLVNYTAKIFIEYLSEYSASFDAYEAKDTGPYPEETYQALLLHHMQCALLLGQPIIIKPDSATGEKLKKLNKLEKKLKKTEPLYLYKETKSVINKFRDPAEERLELENKQLINCGVFYRIAIEIDETTLLVRKYHSNSPKLIAYFKKKKCIPRMATDFECENKLKFIENGWKEQLARKMIKSKKEESEVEKTDGLEERIRKNEKQIAELISKKRLRVQEDHVEVGNSDEQMQLKSNLRLTSSTNSFADSHYFISKEQSMTLERLNELSQEIAVIRESLESLRKENEEKQSVMSGKENTSVKRSVGKQNKKTMVLTENIKKMKIKLQKLEGALLVKKTKFGREGERMADSSITNDKDKLIPSLPSAKKDNSKAKLLECYQSRKKQQVDLALKEKKNTKQVQLTLRAQHYGYQCHDVPGDGNCFFHSVFEQLSADFKEQYMNVQALREAVANHIVEQFGLYRAAVTEDFNSFCEKIREDGEWADQIIILALSRVLNQTIAIVHDNGSEPTVIRQQNAVGTLYLGYQFGLHYQYLTPSDLPVAEQDLQVIIDTTEYDADNPLHLPNIPLNIRR